MLRQSPLRGETYPAWNDGDPQDRAMSKPRSPLKPLARLIRPQHRQGDVRGHSSAARQLPAPVRAGLYVDVENLRDTRHAQRVVEAVLDQWPNARPPVGKLSLYVPAQKAELWRFWARNRFPDLALRVRGVQRFTRLASKNAADMAIAVDAIHDFATTAAGHVAVVSNDSDFAALFVKIMEIAGATEPAPFLWITVGGSGGISQDIEQFVRAEMRWNIAVDSPASGASAGAKRDSKPERTKAAPAGATQPSPKPSPNAPKQTPSKPDNRVVADRLIAELPEGTFKAQHALNVIARIWPHHSAAGNTQLCGQFLAKELWPLLRDRGVKLVRETSPRTYEIGKDVKTRRSP